MKRIDRNTRHAACVALLFFAPAALCAQGEERRLGEAMPMVEEMAPEDAEIAARHIEINYENAVIIEDPLRGTKIVSKSRWKNWVARAIYLLLFNIALTIVIISMPKNEEQNIIISYFLSGSSFTLCIWVLFCAFLLIKWGSASAAMIFPLSLVMFVMSYIVLMKVRKFDVSLSEIRESFQKMAGAKSEDSRLASIYGKPGDWPNEDFIKQP